MQIYALHYTFCQGWWSKLPRLGRFYMTDTSYCQGINVNNICSSKINVFGIWRFSKKKKEYVTIYKPYNNKTCDRWSVIILLHRCRPSSIYLISAHCWINRDQNIDHLAMLRRTIVYIRNSAVTLISIHIYTITARPWLVTSYCYSTRACFWSAAASGSCMYHISH